MRSPLAKQQISEHWRRNAAAAAAAPATVAAANAAAAAAATARSRTRNPSRSRSSAAASYCSGGSRAISASVSRRPPPTPAFGSRSDRSRQRQLLEINVVVFAAAASAAAATAAATQKLQKQTTTYNAEVTAKTTVRRQMAAFVHNSISDPIVFVFMQSFILGCILCDARCSVAPTKTNKANKPKGAVDVPRWLPNCLEMKTQSSMDKASIQKGLCGHMFVGGDFLPLNIDVAPWFRIQAGACAMLEHSSEKMPTFTLRKPSCRGSTNATNRIGLQYTFPICQVSVCERTLHTPEARNNQKT